jgi:Na+/H+ antiporter NhaD/arsenite permease-like protein
MIVFRSDVDGVSREVEWPAILFFVGLFVMVGRWRRSVPFMQ